MPPDDQSHFKTYFARGWRAETILSIATVSACAFWASAFDVARTTYATGPGERQQVTFCGGAIKMDLNTRSRVTVFNSPISRTAIVIFEAGEVAFDVRENPHCDLITFAGRARVDHVGTKYSVKETAERQSITLTVQDGVVILNLLSREKVGVASPGASSPLHADTIHSEVISRGGRVTITPARDRIALRSESVPDDRMQRDLAWKHGMLQFEGDPLSYAVGEFNRYNKTELALTNPEVCIKVPVRGGYLATDPAAFVSTLVDERKVVILPRSLGDPSGTIRLQCL